MGEAQERDRHGACRPHRPRDRPVVPPARAPPPPPPSPPAACPAPTPPVPHFSITWVPAAARCAHHLVSLRPAAGPAHPGPPPLFDRYAASAGPRPMDARWRPRALRRRRHGKRWKVVAGAGGARRGGCLRGAAVGAAVVGGADGNNRRRGRPDSSGRAGLKFAGGYGAAQVAGVRQRGGHVTPVRGRWTRA